MAMKRRTSLPPMHSQAPVGLAPLPLAAPAGGGAIVGVPLGIPSAPIASDVYEHLGSVGAWAASSGTNGLGGPSGNEISIARFRARSAHGLTVYSQPSVPYFSSSSGSASPYAPKGNGNYPRLLIKWGVGSSSFVGSFPCRRPVSFVADYLEVFAQICNNPVNTVAAREQDSRWGAYFTCGIGIGKASALALPTTIVASPNAGDGGGNASLAKGTILGNSGGTLMALTGYNNAAAGAAATYLQLYDELTLALVSSSFPPVWETLLPAQGTFSYDLGGRGREFGAGLHWVCSSTTNVFSYDATQTVRVDAELLCF